MNDLLQIRWKSFLYESLSLVLTAVVGVLVSPEFQALVTAHFGESVVGGVILLVVTGVVKHLRNKKVLKNIGSIDNPKVLI